MNVADGSVLSMEGLLKTKSCQCELICVEDVRIRNQELEMVQRAGFEPAKHYALGPHPSPFDHSVPLLELCRLVWPISE